MLFALFFLTICTATDVALPDKCPVPPESKIVRLGAMFPMGGGWNGGVACKPAAKLALAHVNCHPTKSLVDGYKLEIEDEDTNCEAGKGIINLYHFLYEKKDKNSTIVAMLGPGCSSVSTAVAEAAHLWNLLMVSYGSSSPALSNRGRFPTFFRTHPSALIHNPARVTLFKRFNWDRVFALVHLQEVFTTTVKNLTLSAAARNISVKQNTFQTDPKLAIQSLKQQDARIIVGLFYEVEARIAFCEAYKQGMYGPRIVWFILGWFPDNWWKPPSASFPCTLDEMREATHGHFTTEILQLDRSVTETFSGLLPGQFDTKIKEVLEQDRVKDPSNAGGFPESPLAYDAVWALAIALNSTIIELKKQNALPIEKEFHYNDGITFKLLKKFLDKTNFKGVSGDVTFSSGDRVSSVKIEYMENGTYLEYASSHSSSALELRHTRSDNWVFAPDKFMKNIPKDGIITTEELEALSRPLFIVLSVIAFLGIVFSCVLLAFSFFFRARKVVSNSKPGINCVMLVGCQMVLSCVFLNGVFMNGVDEHIFLKFHSLCQDLLWLMTIGFTLSYGSLFAKIWCLHLASSKVKPKKGSHSSAAAAPGAASPGVVSHPVISGKLSRLSSSANSRHDNGAASPQITSKVSATVSTVAPNPEEQRPPVQVNSASIYAVVCALLIFDLCYLSAFSLFSPLSQETVLLEERNKTLDGEERVQPFIQHCRCDNYNIWISGLLGYKGLLLLVGAFFAYETRNVVVSNINDARYVGLSIYNIATLLCITGPVTMLIKSHQDASYTFSSLAIILCALITEGLIFAPKLCSLDRLVVPGEPEVVTAEDEVNRKREAAAREAESEKYKALAAENDAVVKMIAQRDEYLVTLRAKLEHLIETRFQSRVRGPMGKVPIAHIESFTEFLHADCNPDRMSQSDL